MKFVSALAGLLYLSALTSGQTRLDTLYSYEVPEPLTIDGIAEESAWAIAEWHAINQVWIPYDAPMKAGDFEGRFKVAWDMDYLYVLVEVVDDSLSDDYDNPLEHWWDDDCLEIFIDENRSMGDHERNCNAFAYHVSLSFDAIDLDSYGNGINYRENLFVAMDTLAEDTYMWEFAIKMYDASFRPDSPEESRVYLENNKLMGFAIAYCDNDESNARENFIGSMEMIRSQANDMYKNADHFGPLQLKQEHTVGLVEQERVNPVRIYPQPADTWLHIESNFEEEEIQSVSISSLSGQILIHHAFTGHSGRVNIESLESGAYLLELLGKTRSSTRIIIKE